MRENIKNVGLILALVIAGISLPTSIISVMDKPIIRTPAFARISLLTLGLVANEIKHSPLAY